MTIKTKITTLLRHACILLGVVLLPVIVYDMQIPHLEFAGAVTYPLYAAYWIAKIKRRRLRFVLFHLFTMLVVTIPALSIKATPTLMAALPTFIALAPLPASLFYRSQGARERAANCVFSSLMTLPLGLLLSGFALYAIGMSSAMSAVRD